MKIIVYHVCQIALNRTLLRKFEKWCNFSCCITAKLRNKRPACTRQQAQLRQLKISLHKPSFLFLFLINATNQVLMSYKILNISQPRTDISLQE